MHIFSVYRSNAFRALFFLVLILFANSGAEAQLRLPSFFSDNMVLQQKDTVNIWGWATPGKQVRVTGTWNGKTFRAVAGKDGSWQVAVPTPAAGGPFDIKVTEANTTHIRNVMIGEVWLCGGQSNMEMPLKGFRDQPILGSNEAIFHSANNNIRVFTMPRAILPSAQDTTKHTEWKIAAPQTAGNFSATAYHFGRLIQQRLNVPVGLVVIAYGGSRAEAWMSEAALKTFPSIQIPPKDTAGKLNNKIATGLYNAMLHPFIGYGIRGCIWYQGESNYDRPDEYETLFPALVDNWRNEFAQGSFPFYFAQIAPYNYAQLPPYTTGGKFNSAHLRDAQRKAAERIPQSGMVVLMDVGEEASIHPGNKEVVGRRLAYLALANTYGEQGFAAMSPAFDSMKIDGEVAVISFKHAPNGLTSFGKPLTQFEIAAKDGFWRPGHAVIHRGTVRVSSPFIKDPVAVRYAFKDFVVGELFSTEGLPVSSFRTDNW